MRDVRKVLQVFAAATVSTGFAVALAGAASAHCDTTSGPVITDAKSALDSGDITPVLKWVKKDAEPEVRTAFTKTQAVRGNGPEAKDLADHYFFETLVRVHRAGEGAPYTGIKDEPAEPIVAMADEALVDSSADPMIAAISSHMSAAVKERFRKALDARKNKDKSVEAGRDFVAAYVEYMHFVERIHTAIVAVGDHHGAGAEPGGPAPATSAHSD